MRMLKAISPSTILPILLLVQAACQATSGIGQARRLVFGCLRGIGGCEANSW